MTTIIDTVFAIVRRGWRFLTWVMLLLLIMAIPMNIGIEYSNTPKFCGSCHIMDPYYDAWKVSAHKNVACTECHFPPSLKGKLWTKFQGLNQLVSYVTRTAGTRPTAHVEDGSCTKCHALPTLDGMIPFGKARFNHSTHFDSSKIGRELKCTTCHAQITSAEHISIDKGACFLCHMKDQPQGEAVGGCTSCHELPAKKIEGPGISFDHSTVADRGMSCRECHSGITTPGGAVNKSRCLECHADPAWIDEWDKAKASREGSDAIHKTHVTARSIDCRSCHDEILHGKEAKAAHADGGKSGACASCHGAGHGDQKSFLAGVGAADVPETPSLMARCNVSCESCHNTPDGHGKARENRCIACHGSGVKTMLAGWSSALDEWKKTVREDVKAVETALGAECPEAAKKLVSDAKANLDLVDRAHGEHNIGFSQAIYAKAVEQLRGALDLGKKTADVKSPTFAKSGGGDCRLCHAGADSIETTFKDKPFPHGPHLKTANLACDDCHSAQAGKKHGALEATPDKCTECHHEDDNADCTKCHAREAEFYNGRGLPGPKAEPDVMSKQVPCVACHADRNAKDQVALHRSKCVECHEEKYGPMFDEWLKEEKSTVQNLADLLFTARGTLTEGDRLASGYAEAKAIVEDAEKTLAAVRDARFVHNPAYARSAIAVAAKNLERVRGLLGLAH